jgi:hypothetical protein
VMYRMLQLPYSEFPISRLQQPSTLNFQYSKRLRNPFPLICYPCKRAAKPTVFLEKIFKKIDVNLACCNHSRCIHDTQHLPLPIEIESSANMQRSSMPWHAWKEKIASTLHDILCTLVWLIKSIDEANTIPPRHDFCRHNCLQCHIS